MKELNNQEDYCQNCGYPLIYVDHYEVDGVTEFGSHEPYFTCVNGCEEPQEERIDTIDTCTELDIINVSDEPINKESVIL